MFRIEYPYSPASHGGGQYAVFTGTLMGDHRVAKIYGVDSLPMTLLIDRTGKIAQIHVGLPEGGKEEFRQEIEAALAR